MRHIREASDGRVGNHFIFSSHRDIDKDGAKTDRERKEIKVAPGGPDNLKAREGETFTYISPFKISWPMKFSNAPTHLFQLGTANGTRRRCQRRARRVLASVRGVRVLGADR